MNTMDHQQAVKKQAAERYLLEELTPEERDGFEEHYFSCVQCADEVRSAFTFAENAKAVLIERRAAPVATPRAAASWWSWLNPAFAPALATLLLGVIVYQSFMVIPRLERSLETATAPRVIPSTVARTVTRGDAPVVQLSSDDQFLQVILDINTSLPVSSYVCEVYDESGTLRFAVPAPVPTAGASLNLLLPASGLKPGRFTIKVRSSGSGSRSETSDSYSFVVQRN